MSRPSILVVHWLPEGRLARWAGEFPRWEFIDARRPEALEAHLAGAEIIYGFPDLARLPQAASLRWIQLASAGVPEALCPAAKKTNLRVTNLAGLYGPTIAEHALGMVLFLSRNMHAAFQNQAAHRWDRGVMEGVRDLHRRTLAVVGLGNIGQNIARLARAFGMRVLGCRRRPQPTPLVDQVFGPQEIRAMLAEADVVAVAAPLTARTQGLLGPAEFQALKTGTIFVNVSRGPVAQEAALIDALRSGRLGAAGLDVFAVEPLPADNPLWTMANVLVSPHYSGETVNFSSLPAERFERNLRAWSEGRALEGVVDLDEGY